MNSSFATFARKRLSPIMRVYLRFASCSQNQSDDIFARLLKCSSLSRSRSSANLCFANTSRIMYIEATMSSENPSPIQSLATL